MNIMKKYKLSIWIMFFLIMLSVNAKATDLSVNITDVTLNNNLFNILVNLSNIGNERVNNIDLAVFLNNADEPSDQIEIETLVAGESVMKTLLVPENLSIIRYDFLVIATPENLSKEENLWNNIDEYKIYVGYGNATNLVAEMRITDKIYVNQTGAIEISVTNIGTLNATNVSVNLKVNNDTLLDYKIPVLEHTKKFEKTVAWTPKSQIAYIINLTAFSNEIDIYPSNNIVTLNVIPHALTKTKFLLTDHNGNMVSDVSLGIKNEYITINRSEELNIEPTRQTISIHSINTLDSIKFLNSLPNKTMKLVFEDNGERIFGNKYFYKIYSFRADWEYSGIEIEFNSLPNVNLEQLSVYVCANWSWEKKDCLEKWIKLNTIYGSVKANTTETIEAAALVGPKPSPTPTGETQPSSAQPGGAPIMVLQPEVNLTEEQKPDISEVIREEKIECEEEGKTMCKNAYKLICKNNRWEIKSACVYGCLNNAECKPVPAEPEEKIAQLQDYILYIGIIVAIIVLFVLVKFFVSKRR